MVHVGRLEQRAAGALLVAGLHVLLVAGLLAINFAEGIQRAAPPPEERIVMLNLPRAQVPTKSTAAKKGAEQTGETIIPSELKGDYFVPEGKAAALGMALFRCTPEHVKDLTPEEREKCARMGGFNLTAFMNAPKHLDPPPEKLRNSDIRARERNTADPCAIAKMGKMATAECYHEIAFGKGLW